MDTGLDIGKALRFLGEGDCIWRIGWHGKQYVHTYICGVKGYIALCAHDGVRPWVPLLDDLIVEDWCAGFFTEALVGFPVGWTPTPTPYNGFQLVS